MRHVRAHTREIIRTAEQHLRRLHVAHHVPVGVLSVIRAAHNDDLFRFSQGSRVLLNDPCQIGEGADANDGQILAVFFTGVHDEVHRGGGILPVGRKAGIVQIGGVLTEICRAGKRRLSGKRIAVARVHGNRFIPAAVFRQ